MEKKKLKFKNAGNETFKEANEAAEVDDTNY